MRVALVLMLVAGCAADGLPLRDWTLVADGRESSVRLPNHLGKYISDRGVDFTLRRRVAMSTQRGQPLTLVIENYRGELALFVDGLRTPDVGDISIGERRFLIAPARTDRDEVIFELRGRRNYFSMSGFRTVPRLAVGFVERPTTLAVVNRTVNVAGLACAIVLVTLFATMFVFARRREYGAITVLAVAAVPNLLKPTGALDPLGGYARPIKDVADFAANIGILYAIVWMFDRGRPSRSWIGAMLALLVARLCNWATPLPPLFHYLVWIEFLFALYLTYLLVRVASRGEHRHDARVLLFGWIAYPIIAFGNFVLNRVGDAHTFGGFNEKPAIIVLMLLLSSIVLARQHAARGQELERATKELRFQVAERSRDLAETLAQLARQPIVPEADVIIAGRYRILRHLGAGGMGSVYEAERLSDRRRVALKVLHGSSDAATVARFGREAHIAAKLDHPNLVPIVDVGIDDGRLYLVMPVVAGTTVEQERARFGDEGWARPLLLQIARGLAAMHAQRIVHRDLKPSNILIEDGIARIADFGVASLAAVDPLAQSTLAPNPPTLTHADAWLGTPKYMAPEVAASVRDATAASDVFAFGVIAREMLGNAADVAVDAVIEMCLAREPSARPSSADVVLALDSPSTVDDGR